MCVYKIYFSIDNIYLHYISLRVYPIYEMVKMRFNKTISGKENKKAIIIFPHWDAKPYHYYLMTRRLSRDYCVILYNYSSDLISTNLKQTTKNFDTIMDDVNKTIDLLSDKYTSFSVVGFSIGTYLAFMIAKQNQKIEKIFSVTASSSFSDILWNGENNKKERMKFQRKKISQRKTRIAWSKIAPAFNIDKIKSRVFLVLTKNDKTIPYKLGKDFAQRLEKHHIQLKTRIHKYLTHRMTIAYYITHLDPLYAYLES